MFYVLSKINPADAPSRRYSDADCKLTPEAWSQAERCFGPYSFDLMSLAVIVRRIEMGNLFHTPHLGLLQNQLVCFPAICSHLPSPSFHLRSRFSFGLDPSGWQHSKPLPWIGCYWERRAQTGYCSFQAAIPAQNGLPIL